MNSRPAAVVIGRNEGARLLRCLESLRGLAEPIVYVDSGSTDGSVAAARAHGVEVVSLDLRLPFTAGRARNAGRAHVQTLAGSAAPTFVQFVDGDCEVQAAWLPQALAFLEAHPTAAVACGRRRERFPEASLFNRLCDLEWDTRVGEARACGGDALIRLAAFDQVNGYRDTLIAGEEPELCVRLRRAGWTIHRLDAEMTLHDAAMFRLSQWWRRMQRSGHAFAEGATLHGAPPERHYVAETRRALIWGLGIPVLTVLAALLIGPAAALILLVYPAQVIRLALRSRRVRREAWLQALFHVIGRFPEAHGVVTYLWRRRLRSAPRLIEYK